MTQDFISAVLWLTINCFYECRNESIAGQVAVAQVVVNRSKVCSASIKDTVMLDRQFSWTAIPLSKQGYINPHSNKKMDALEICASTSVLAMFSPDLTSGATYYHSTKIDKPNWASKRKEIVTIGGHVFYGGNDFRCK